MGKKKAVSHQPLLAKTTKISKKDQEDQRDQKYQFQSLIKVLKPKVYITDDSNFRRLVQELTGNGNSSTWFPPSLESTMAPEGVFVNKESVYYDYQSICSSRSSVETSSGKNSSFTIDHSPQQQSEYQYQYQSCSVDVSDSADASTGSPVSSDTTGSYDQEYAFSYQQFGTDDTTLQEYMTEVLEDLFAYQEIESFLMDDDHTETTPSLYNLFA